MKKLSILLLAAVTFSSVVNAQSTPAKDTTAPVELTQSTPLFTADDYNNFYNQVVADMPTGYGLKIVAYWDQLMQKKSAAWKAAHTPVPATTPKK